MTITEFLEARISEDEADHYPYHAADFGYAPGDETYGCVACGMEAGHCRTQRECAAKRRRIQVIQDGWVSYNDDNILGDLLALEALPYADHPDYDPQWSV